MSTVISDLSASEQETIAYETGLTGGAINSINGYTWNRVSQLAGLFNAANGSPRKWGDAEVGTSGGTVTYTFDPGSNFTAAQEATYVAAMTLWSDEADITFAPATNPATAQATYYLINSPTPGTPLDQGTYEYSYNTGTATPGSTTVPTTNYAYIQFDTSGGFGDPGSLTSVGGYGVGSVVHELGHLIGLNHTGPYNGDVNASVQQYNATDMKLYSIMSYIVPSTATAKYYKYYTPQGTNWGTNYISQTPQMLDILAAQEIYGTPTNTGLSGGQVFGFNSNITDATKLFFNFTINVNPVVTLWDSGTDNTLDLSGFYTPSVVDLNPGSFSSCDGMTNNIAIAYNTAIDTAIGGFGNDTFIVNSGSDTINGGGGSNTVRFSGTLASYQISRNSAGTITVANGAITDTLTNIQTLVFADQTIVASSIPENQQIYSWIQGNGTYSAAGSWFDVSTGGPATMAPGAQDIALIDGPTAGGPQTMSGDGAASQMVFTGLTGVVGNLSPTLLTVGQGGGESAFLTIAPGATITAQSAAITNGTLNDNGVLNVLGTLLLSPADSASTTTLSVRSGGTVQVQSLVLAGGTVALDSSSALKVGDTGAAKAAGITVGADGQIAGFGLFGYPAGGVNTAINDYGTITASNGTLTTPPIIGTGVLQIAAGATLKTSFPNSGSGTALPTIAFLSSTGSLAFSVGSPVVLGDISGFSPGGDSLALSGSSGLLQPVYTPGTAADTGALSVSNVNGTVAMSTTLDGNYAGRVFLLQPDTGSTYDVITAPGSLTGSTTPSAGTNGETYAWYSAGAGDWNTASNWAVQQTSSQTIATVAPGAADIVVIGTATVPNTVLVVSGDGNADALLITGQDAFSGLVTAANLGIGLVGDPASLDLIGTARLQTTGAEIANGELDVAAGTTFSDSGILAIVSSPSQSVAPLEIYGGGVVQVGTLALGGAAAPVAIDSSSVLEVGTAGGATPGALTVDAGNTMAGSGNIGSNIVYNYGTVTAEDGTLTVRAAAGTGTYNIAASSTLGVIYQTGNTSIMELPTFDFAGSNATLLLNLALGSVAFSFGTVAGFAAGETIAFSGTSGALPTSFTYTSTESGTGTLVLSDTVGTTTTLTLRGTYSQSDFTLTQSSPSTVDLTIPCFASGSLLATPDGQVAVEALRVGDRVTTVEGEARPVIWIGQRRIDCRRHPRPEQVWPVRIARNAFGPGLPARDLRLSPDHAIFSEGVLIPVKHLINGTSVVQERVAHVTYWHVELPSHSVVLAEWLPAESYLDTGDRSSFVNGGGALRLHPAWGLEARDVTLVMDALACAPLRVTGPEVERVRSRLANESFCFFLQKEALAVS